jgi:5-methylcytosine-specific restriction endonuclease McrA
MNTNALSTAATLSDQELLAHLSTLAGREREASAELVAHLAALDARPSLYAARGYGSLHAYCTEALRFSEDAASNRIEAARACRRFPMILDLLASGEMTLTSARLLGRHLTPENHRAVLQNAKGRTLKQIDLLVATLDPQPDALSLVRKLPTAMVPAPAPTAQVATSIAPALLPTATPGPAAATPRPIIRPTAPERYRVQFTIGEATHEKLRRLQALLRREIPSGDPGVIFDRAVTLLLEHVENKKLGATERPRSRPPIRRETDNEDIRTPPPPSRDVPRAVKRTVWKRDGGQCAFVSADGRRCTEREFLEFHHVQAYAKNGPATVDNISLRCRRHNQYEAERIFGPAGARETRRPVPSRWSADASTAAAHEKRPGPMS